MGSKQLSWAAAVCSGEQHLNRAVGTVEGIRCYAEG